MLSTGVQYNSLFYSLYVSSYVNVTMQIVTFRIVELCTADFDEIEKKGKSLISIFCISKSDDGGYSHLPTDPKSLH